jgi:hypothetical protein
MIISRKQFREYWEKIDPKFAKWDSPLWCLEYRYGKSRWFVNVVVNELRNHENFKEYHQWVLRNCRGRILCYSSNAEEEWWGFSHKPDVFLWILRWS